MNFPRIAICVFAVLIALPSIADAQRGDDGPISFVNDVVPIINAKCGSCHVRAARGRYDIKSYKALMGSDSVSPDEPGDSLFIEVIEDGTMPKGGKKVSDSELKTLKQWIAEGAKFDGDSETQVLSAIGGGGGDRGAGRGRAGGRGQASGRGGSRSAQGRSSGRRSSGRRSGRSSRPNAFDSNALLKFFDTDGNGVLTLNEIDAAKRLLYSLDVNEDDRLTQEEVKEFGK